MPNEKVNRRGFLGSAAVGPQRVAGRLRSCHRRIRQAAKFSFRPMTSPTACRDFCCASDDLAPEYNEADITTHFRANGTYDPPDKDYRALARNNFVDWRLVVDGLVDTPLKLSLDRPARPAVADSDYPSRLRRGLELHRQMDRHAALRSADACGCEATGEICGFLLRRLDGWLCRRRLERCVRSTRPKIRSTPDQAAARSTGCSAAIAIKRALLRKPRSCRCSASADHSRL